MSEKTKSLCAKIPESLHAKVREKQTQTDKNLDAYMTWLIAKFYEMPTNKMSSAN